MTASEDEDSDLDGDNNLAPLSSSEDEDDMEDVEEEEEEASASDDDMEEDRYAGSDEEQDYELKPRKVSQEWTKKDKFTKLPIKLPGGKWEQAAEEEYSDDEEEKDEPVPEIDSELSEIEMEDLEETTEPKKKSFLARKEELAQIASTIMEDPESNVRVHALTTNLKLSEN